jgi:hypothetical protein
LEKKETRLEESDSLINGDLDRQDMLEEGCGMMEFIPDKLKDANYEVSAYKKMDPEYAICSSCGSVINKDNVNVPNKKKRFLEGENESNVCFDYIRTDVDSKKKKQKTSSTFLLVFIV